MYCPSRISTRCYSRSSCADWSAGPTVDAGRAAEAKVLDLFREQGVELVVLARYMQVLSDDFLGNAPPVINIHHGFLPAFQGARPYHQAGKW